MTGLPPRMRPKSVRILDVPVSSLVRSLEIRDRNGLLLNTVPVKAGHAQVVVEESEQIVTISAKGADLLSEPIDLNLASITTTEIKDTVKVISLVQLKRTKEVFQIPAVNFDRSEFVLKPSAMIALEKFYRMLPDHTTRIVVTGHTDNVGTVEMNIKLSLDRAQTVKDYLVKLGYSEALIQVDGKGWSQPLSPNTSEVLKAKNRRVEFQFVK